MYCSEASEADGPDVFDDSNWQNMEGGVMIDVGGTSPSMTLPMAMDVAMSGSKHE